MAVNKSGVETDGDAQLMVNTIDRYVNLMRIKNAADRDAEIAFQERELRAILRVLDIPVEKLVVH
ncbi:MAG: hypothetical protein IJT94_15335 [Oscillibacter sp.]|nr:hypothetical protein [Oscillibacter sp.]